MPTKLCFWLEGPAPDTPFQHRNGLRALVLDWVHCVDVTLATTLHDSNQVKPYTISPLWPAEGDARRHCFELSLLADWLLEPLLVGAAQHSPQVALGPQRFHITGWEIALETDWKTLLAPAPKGLYGFDFALRTPTAPLPRMVYYRQSLPLPWLARSASPRMQGDAAEG